MSGTVHRNFWNQSVAQENFNTVKLKKKGGGAVAGTAIPPPMAPQAQAQAQDQAQAQAQAQEWERRPRRGGVQGDAKNCLWLFLLKMWMNTSWRSEQNDFRAADCRGVYPVFWKS